MSTTIETGLADLITIYEVRAHLLALRPDLASGARHRDARAGRRGHG